MAKLKKPLPEFKTEEEEAEYWDSHSPLEHFDESDFKPLQVRQAKDTPITIRLDSESRQALEEVARAYKVGPSTLVRMLVSKALERWRQKKQKPELSLTIEDAEKAFMRPFSDALKQEAKKLFEESKAGSFYILPESALIRLSKILVRDFFEAAGYKIVPDDELKKEVPKKSHAVQASSK